MPPPQLHFHSLPRLAQAQSQGFEVVHARHFTPAIAVPHPILGTEVNGAALYDWVRKHTPSNVDGVFIAGNGWRTIGVIAALEEDLIRPVLTARQAPFWYALRLADVGAPVEDYGQVFKVTGSVARSDGSVRHP